MQIYVENVGRVANAKVKLDGITMVAGGNASGKSTISKALYAGLSASYHVQENTQGQMSRSINRVFRDWTFENSWFRNISIRKRSDIRRSILVLLKKPQIEKEMFINFLKKILGGYVELEKIKNSIDELYNSYCDIHIKGDEYYRNFYAQSVLDSIFYNQLNTEDQLTDARIDVNYGKENVCLQIINNKLQSFDINTESEYTINPIYITTSNLMDSLKQFSTGMEQELSSANTKLAQLMMREFNAVERTAEEYYAVEDQKRTLYELLNQVIDGELKRSSTRLVFRENWCNADIEIPNIASGMKIFVMLKRLVSNGSLLGKNMLIIDEPETNLHPEWQLKLAELLVLVYKHLNICIYLNSHSPYFVRAIEYYANLHGVLDATNFYLMEPSNVSGMYQCSDVTNSLGKIYDKMAEPFNQIM